MSNPYDPQITQINADSGLKHLITKYNVLGRSRTFAFGIFPHFY